MGLNNFSNFNLNENINNEQYYDIEIDSRDGNHISVKNIPSDINRKEMILTLDTIGNSVLSHLEQNLNYDMRGTLSSDKGGLKIKEFTIEMGEGHLQKVHITFRENEK